MPSRYPKTVRFAYRNIFHPSPPTPAMSSSTITPPTRSYSLPASRPSRYGTNQYPSSYESSSAPNYGGHVTSHRYFDASAICWDVRDHPSSITRSHRPLSGHALYEPATTPPTSFMRITSPYLPWSIKVSATNGSFVSVEDVVEAIYTALRANIRQSEFNLLTSPHDQARASRAYEERYRRLRSMRMYEEEKRTGMKRVDFLMGRTRFVELSNDGRRADEWRLSVA